MSDVGAHRGHDTRVRIARTVATPLVVALLSAGCGGPHFGRIGTPVALANGAPRTACEREEWLELVPARVNAMGTTTSIGFHIHYSQVHEGLGVFTYGDDDPVDLEDVWPRLAEPELERRHQAPIEAVDAAHLRSLFWAVGGLAGMVGGIGAATAIQDESPTAATVVGVSGLVVGLVGVVGALASQPSGAEQVHADARRKLFIPGEDDLDAAARGVDRANAAQRRACGGTPVEPGPVRRKRKAPRAEALGEQAVEGASDVQGSGSAQ